MYFRSKNIKHLPKEKTNRNWKDVYMYMCTFMDSEKLQKKIYFLE